MFWRAGKRIKWFVDLAQACWQADRRGLARFFRRLSHGVRVCREGRFTPEEVYIYKLLDPTDQSAREFPVISRKALTKLQKALNPQSHVLQLRDKSNFYRRCESAGLAATKCYHVFVPGQQRADQTTAMLDCLPAEFVAKPTNGSCGHGVGIFTRDGGGFRDTGGRLFNSEQLVAWLCLQAGDGGMILQRRLANHAELVRLTGCQYLQSLRIYTLLDDNGEALLMYSNLKTTIGDHVLDSLADDEPVAGMRVPVDMATGRFEDAVQIPGTRPGFSSLPSHPRTGVQFAGFAVPLWAQTCQLARRAALEFSPIRAVAWDIALTPDGPLLNEGNVFWDPPNGQRQLPFVISQLARAAGMTKVRTW